VNNKRLQLRKEGNIFFLTLTAPPANPTDHLFFQELTDIMPVLTGDDCPYGLIIYGSGRHFSSGADIDELKTEMRQDNSYTASQHMKRSIDLFNGINELSYPVIAAIRGCCLGSGLELALSCHYRIATKNGLFALPETTYGLMPGCGGTIRLSHLIGRAKAIEMILSGNGCLAEDGLQIGLIDRIVDKCELLTTAEQIIHRLQTHKASHTSF